ncbi:hypothetical protein NPIL_672741 [Nephila pilipes]|uniref:Uncharacterized protein n=1 Tax=Nephila pilipes TaxID=299642 RepID=A0A8X6N8L1_NEPPI|nr:hypothetical protein NPIL_672741 [Nephila pilipes]
MTTGLIFEPHTSTEEFDKLTESGILVSCSSAELSINICDDIWPNLKLVHVEQSYLPGFKINMLAVEKTFTYSVAVIIKPSRFAYICLLEISHRHVMLRAQWASRNGYLFHFQQLNTYFVLDL